jgi:hypothetical protein
MGLIEVVIRVLSDYLRPGFGVGSGRQWHTPYLESTVIARTYSQGQKPLPIRKPILGTIGNTIARDDLFVSAAVG